MEEPAGSKEMSERLRAHLPENIRDLSKENLRERSRLGLVQVYTGNGKGKTTASLGLALRAAGYGFRTSMVQFLKTGYTGEVLALRKFGNLPIEIISYGKKCVNHETHEKEFAEGRFESYCRNCFTIDEADKKFCEEALKEGEKRAESGEWDVVILDEINIALSFGLVSVERVLEVIGKTHMKTELILTGRNAPKGIIDAADVVNEVSFLKHPYDKGIYARKGIEF